MKPESSFVGQPIRSLQTMLRTIASVEPRQVNVMPDGIYGSQTAEAVRSFQRRLGLPVNGNADRQFWDVLMPEYQRARVESDAAYPLQIKLDPGQVLRRGEQNNHLYLIQSMLTVLSLLSTGIPAPGHTGRLDGPTEASIAAFQTFAGLPPTGEIDKRTWKELALQYILAADYLENRSEL